MANEVGAERPADRGPTCGRVRFGDYEFDPSTGDLAPISANACRSDVRLAPQPARLLSLLASRDGAIVTRDEIQAELWPDVEVEFDQSLNFCIRQIRAALNDSAVEPRYIETLPRRGYRLLPPVVPARSSVAGTSPATIAPGDSAPLPAVRVASDGAHRFLRPALLLLLGLVLAAFSGLLIIGPAELETLDAQPPRLGVMPFEPPATREGFPNTTRIAAELVRLLGNQPQEIILVGPATTSAHDGTGSVRDFAASLQLDYVLNDRFLDEEAGPELLLELIRVSDGAHVWVDRFDQLDDWRRIAPMAAAAVGRELRLHSAPQVQRP